MPHMRSQFKPKQTFQRVQQADKPNTSIQVQKSKDALIKNAPIDNLEASMLLK
jgi:hypothetical protein